MLPGCGVRERASALFFSCSIFFVIQTDIFGGSAENTIHMLLPRGGACRFMHAASLLNCRKMIEGMLTQAALSPGRCTGGDSAATDNRPPRRAVIAAGGWCCASAREPVATGVGHAAA
jgi:hypothetical protein